MTPDAQPFARADVVEALLRELRGYLQATVRPQRISTDHHDRPLLAVLAAAVGAFEASWHGFLSGRQPCPSTKLAGALRVAFRELASERDRPRPTTLRVEALEARFHAAQRLFAQRLARLESGRSLSPLGLAS